MSQWTDAQISRFAQAGEEELATKFDLIIDRISLQVDQGYSIYDVPDYIIGIRRITWKGMPLEPRSGQELFNSGSAPIDSMDQGKPQEYVYSDIGQKTIKFYPTPNETISALNNPWNIASIRGGVIIEFSRLPDVSGYVYRIPELFRRQIVKDYVNYRCLAMESRKQDKIASNYFMEKWNFSKDQLKKVKSLMFTSTINVMGVQTRRLKIGRPILPPMFPVK